MATLDCNTTDLKVGDIVLWGAPQLGSVELTVTELVDTGLPAVFGKGNQWHIELSNDKRFLQMHTASSDTWRVLP